MHIEVIFAAEVGPGLRLRVFASSSMLYHEKGFSGTLQEVTRVCVVLLHWYPVQHLLNITKPDAE
jgi:hypothetical protein